MLGEVLGGEREAEAHAVQVRRGGDLTAKAAGFSESKRRVEHVILIVRDLAHAFEERLVLNNDVTRGAGKRAFTGAFELNIVRVRHLEHRRARGRIHSDLLAVLLDEGHLDRVAASVALKLLAPTMPHWARCMHTPCSSQLLSQPRSLLSKELRNVSQNR